MTIATMETLAAMPPGAQIQVTTARTAVVWTRTGSGEWEYDGVRLPSSKFEGLVTEGSVIDHSNAPPEVGWLYRSGTAQRSQYLVVELVDRESEREPAQRRVRFARFRDDLYRDEVVYTVEQIRHSFNRLPTGDYPAWYSPVWSTIQRMRRQTAQAVASLSSATESLASARDRLNALEAERQNRPGVVTVTVDGTNQVPTEKADGHVPTAAQISNVVVRWHTTLRLETAGPGCLCDQVTDEWVAEQLGFVEGQPTGAFSYTQDCGRHGE